MEAVRKLKLSDAFVHPEEMKEFEWTATMYNLLFIISTMVL